MLSTNPMCGPYLHSASNQPTSNKNPFETIEDIQISPGQADAISELLGCDNGIAVTLMEGLSFKEILKKIMDERIGCTRFVRG